MAILKMKYGVISADDHVQEAPDVWTKRMSKTKFGDEIPHIVDLPDGSQTWALGRNSKGFGLASGARLVSSVAHWSAGSHDELTAEGHDLFRPHRGRPGCGQKALYSAVAAKLGSTPP